MIRDVRKFLEERKGSATVEFAVLAIPLFIPLFIFLNTFASVSDGQDSLRTLAREAARGFVTSINDEIAFQVAGEIVRQGGSILGYGAGSKDGNLHLDVNCESHPCITANSAVTLTVSLVTSQSKIIKASAIEFVSPWT